MKDHVHTIADARNTLPQLIHQVESGEPVVLSRRGKPVAVLQSYTQYQRDRAMMARQSAPDWFTRTLEWKAGLATRFEGLTDEELDAARSRDHVPPDMDGLDLA